MIEGVTQVKYQGRIGTVIMCHGNGNVNLVMLDNHEYVLNLPRSEIIEIKQEFSLVPNLGMNIPVLGIWARILNFLLFWRRK